MRNVLVVWRGSLVEGRAGSECTASGNWNCPEQADCKRVLKELADWQFLIKESLN